MSLKLIRGAKFPNYQNIHIKHIGNFDFGPGMCTNSTVNGIDYLQVLSFFYCQVSRCLLQVNKLINYVSVSIFYIVDVVRKWSYLVSKYKPELIMHLTVAFT